MNDFIIEPFGNIQTAVVGNYINNKYYVGWYRNNTSPSNGTLSKKASGNVHAYLILR